MSDTPFVGGLLHGRLRDAAERLFWLGLVMVVLGIAAIVFPIASSLVAELLVGWVLLVSGSITLVGSFSIHGTGPFFGALLLALLSIAGGVFLLFNPLAGVVALTLMLGVILTIQGTFEIFLAFEMRPHAGWLGMALSGIASIAIAVLIASGWPGITVFILGVFLGVNFISTGLGYISISHALKHPA